MGFRSRNRVIACLASSSVAALGLVAGCGSSKSKGSKGADPAPAPVTTTPQAPSPTTVGNDQTGITYPGDPNNPGYPNNGGNNPPNQGGYYPPNQTGNVAAQYIETRMIGRWVAQNGTGAMVEFSAGRRFVKGAMQEPGYPGYPSYPSFPGYGSTQMMQGEYVVNPSVTQGNTLGIVLRTAGYPYSSETPCFVSLNAPQYNSPYGLQQETLTLQCADNYQPNSGRQPNFGMAETFVREMNGGYFPQ